MTSRPTMNRRRHRAAGFTLVELMIVVAIIATIAAMAIPKLVSARTAANETAAIAALRTIANAQQQLQASTAIDTDADGGGEHGYLGELAGSNFIRVWTPGGPVISGTDTLEGDYLSISFSSVVADAAGEGVVEYQGYFYKMFLPGPIVAGAVTGIAEAPGGGNPGVLPNGSNAEIMWCCYAWPSQATRTGNRAFFVNETGDVVAYANNDQQYSGIGSVAEIPVFSAAYTGPSMTTQIGLAKAGLNAMDANIWTPVGN